MTYLTDTMTDIIKDAEIPDTIARALILAAISADAPIPAGYSPLVKQMRGEIERLEAHRDKTRERVAKYRSVHASTPQEKPITEALQGVTPALPPVTEASISTSTSTDISTSTDTHTKEKHIDSAFAAWYAAYPRKKSRVAAEKAWKKMRSQMPPIEKMLSVLEEQKKSTEWKKEGGRFAPYPASYLNAGCWDDAIENYATHKHETKPSTFCDDSRPQPEGLPF